MNIKKKIYLSFVLVIPVTIVYYLVYVLVDKLFNQWCKTNYCFEFPPYADILAIYVAVIGLYFVVASLDAWKSQDKYQIGKKNIDKLHDLLNQIKQFNVQLSNLDKWKKNVFFIFDKKDFVTPFYNRYEDFILSIAIFDLANSIDHDINYRNSSLFQEDFSHVINLMHNYLIKIDQDIKQKNKKLIDTYHTDLVNFEILKKQYNNDIDKNSDENLKSILLFHNQIDIKSLEPVLTDLNQDDIDKILTNYHNDNGEFEKKLNVLQEKINNYSA